MYILYYGNEHQPFSETLNDVGNISWWHLCINLANSNL